MDPFRLLRMAPSTLAVSMLLGMSAGCSTLELYPVRGTDGPSVIINSKDVEKVKAAIIQITKRKGFNLEDGGTIGDNLWVSRRLSPAKVFLLTETIPTKNDWEQERFHVEAVNDGVRVYVYRVEHMELPDGRLNEDSLLDSAEYEALKGVLVDIKRRVEGG